MKNNQKRFSGKKRSLSKSSRPGTKFSQQFSLITFEELELRALLAADGLSASAWYSTADISLRSLLGSNLSHVNVSAAPAASAAQGALPATTPGTTSDSASGGLAMPAAVAPAAHALATVPVASPLATLGAATQLVVTAQPSTETSETHFSVAVSVEDASNNVLTGFSGNVTLSILVAGSPTGATLRSEPTVGTFVSGPQTVAVVSGVATFSNLLLDLGGSYTLQATSTGLSAGNTTAITVTPAVKIRLEADDTTTNHVPLTSSNVTVGQDFSLAVFVSDIRSPALTQIFAGVFSTWLNVSYNSALASITPTAHASGPDPGISFGTPFSVVQSGELGTPGLIGDAGAANATSPNTLAEQFLFRVTVHASSVGALTFQSAFDNAPVIEGHGSQLAHPADGVLAPSQFQFGSLALTVVLAGPPTITPATTVENHQSTTGLVISPATVDGASATNYLITGITNGTLFQSDGTTAIISGSMITAAQANAGLKFTPANNFVGQGSFTVQESPDANAADATGTTGVAAITVTPATLTGPPAVTSATTTANVQSASGLVISPAAVDGALATNYLITNITHGTLFQSNGTTAIVNGSMITAAQATAGLRFTPANSFLGQGSFTVQESADANPADASGATATATIAVSLTGPPIVTAATTTANHQTTLGLVISPASADGALATNYLITGITNGTLFQNNGTTPITNGSMITAAQASAGLRFTPANNFLGQGSFTVQESPDATPANASGATATAAITVNLTGPPIVTAATTTANVQTSSGLVISPASADGTLATNFLIANITNGTLFQSNGTTAITNGSMITAAQATAGLKFTPANNFLGQGSFTVQESPDGTAANASGAIATATINVNLTGPPTITAASVTENVQTSSGLVISPASADATLVTNYLITGITNGTLFQSNGTTAIINGSMITVAQATAGLRFTPANNFVGQGSFTIQESPDATAAHASGATGVAAITVTPAVLTGPPAVTSATTTANLQTASGLVISPAAADGTLVTNYLITGITNGTLFQSNGTTAITNGSMITAAQATAGLRFTPANNFLGQGSFTVEESPDANPADASGATATASITVNLTGPPIVTAATTTANLQTASGLVISPASADGALATNFLIANITNGTLFQSNGTTAITNGSMITAAQATAGLKFTPANNFLGQGSFTVQESPDATPADASGAIATATITVNLTGPPTITAATVTENVQTSSGLVISPATADATLVTNYLITGITNGTLFQSNGTTAIINGSMITVAQATAGLRFTPANNFVGQGSFTVQESPDATPAHASGATGMAAITVTPAVLTGPPTVTSATTTANLQTTSGLVISPASADGTLVTNYLITGITNGTLFQSNGTTAIVNGSMITLAQAAAGLRFTPANNFLGQGSFTVQESPDGTPADASGATATASITVNLTGPPIVTSATTTTNLQTTTGLVISPASADGALATNYLITGITNGTLFQSNGTTAIINGSTITAAQATAGLRFTPANNFVGQGSFTVQESPDATAADASGATATATITVNLTGPPTITAATTVENHQTTTGLVISPAPADVAAATNYLITGITNGTLFQSNGTTAIINGSMITAAQATAGLRFTPANNFVGQGSFTVQESPDATAAHASGATGVAAITVTPAVLTGPPTVTSATTTANHQTTSGLVISPASADGTLATNYLITGITNGTLFQNDGVTAIGNGSMITAAQATAGLRFTPASTFVGQGSFTVQESPDGTPADASGATTVATINVTLNNSTISGTVFVDVAGVAAKNGGQYSGQHALDGTLVTLQGFDNTNPNFPSIGHQEFTIGTPGVTDGTYSFTVTAAGLYFITFTPPAGYLPGTVVPHNAADTVEPVQNGIYGFSTSITGGGINDFGNNFFVPGVSHVSLRILLGSSLAPHAQVIAATPQVTVLAIPQAAPNAVAAPLAAPLALPAASPAAAVDNSSLFTQSGDTVTGHGTAGDDNFEFVAGALNTVTINGVTRQFGASVSNIIFDGGGGKDTAKLTGSAGDDTATLGLGSGTLTGSGYKVTVSNVTTLNVTGGLGHDTATLQDSALNDLMQASGDQLTLTNDAGLATAISAFAQVTASSTLGGTDHAQVGAIDFALTQQGNWLSV
jgi:hypothetical protein